MLVETNQAESGQQGCSGRETDVLVMKPAEVGQGDALDCSGRLDKPAAEYSFPTEPDPLTPNQHINWQYMT